MSTNHENEVETSELKKEPDLSGEPDANAFAAESSPTEGNAAEAITPVTEEASKNESPQDAEAKDAAGEEDAEDDTSEDSGKLKKDPLAFTKIVFEYLELFVTSICIVVLIFMFGVRLCSVRGDSMMNTLYPEERLLISGLFYTPERGDVIVFHQTGTIINEPVVKRVIATAGEWVELEYIEEPQNIIIKIYDENMNLREVLDESAYAYYDTSIPIVKPPLHDGLVQVPEGYLFVMGDNRNHSTDSRGAVIGFVDERRILGRVIIRIHPFSRFGAVD